MLIVHFLGDSSELHHRNAVDKANHRNVVDVCEPVCGGKAVAKCEGTRQPARMYPLSVCLRHCIPSVPRAFVIVSKAFTIAEILIAMGILGVIAALTIPMMLQVAQNRELVSQYLKVHNTPYKCLQRN